MEFSEIQIDFLKDLQEKFSKLKITQIDQNCAELIMVDGLPQCGCFGAWIAYFYDLGIKPNIYSYKMGKYHFYEVFLGKLNPYFFDTDYITLIGLFLKHGARGGGIECDIFSKLAWNKYPSAVLQGVLKEVS